MNDLQRQLTLAEQERDAQQQLRTQADAARATAEATAAQALLDLAQAQAAAATANAAVLAAGAAATVKFTLSPALASGTLLNYKSREGIKIYGKATAPLEVLFSGDSGALRLFLRKVQHRATQFGWTDILRINQAGKILNFIEH
jgi:multidrug efflux pump subunit AcrA (membrane-fusion protein)